jgi:hypothetical protein
MKVGRLKHRALTSYFLTSGHRRGLVVLIRINDADMMAHARPVGHFFSGGTHQKSDWTIQGLDRAPKGHRNRERS